MWSSRTLKPAAAVHLRALRELGLEFWFTCATLAGTTDSFHGVIHPLFADSRFRQRSAQAAQASQSRSARARRGG